MAEPFSFSHWDYSLPWYHGSPLVLEVLLTGSTITQDMGLARVFSHKPAIVSIEDESQPLRLRHNGRLPGLLYQVDEPIRPADVYPHPRTSMGAGLEWLTTRPIRLRLIESVDIDPRELLSEEDIQELLSRGSQ